MPHALQVLLLLSLVSASAEMAGALSNRLGPPAVFSELLVGLLLGPTLVDVLAWPVFWDPASDGHRHQGDRVLGRRTLDRVHATGVTPGEARDDPPREVGLSVARYGLAHGIIGPHVFSASVLMVLATTMVTPPLLQLVVPWHAARDEGVFTASGSR